MRINIGSLLLVMFFPVFAFGDSVCEYQYIVNNLKQSCLGINAELQEIKKYATINTIVTGVGTVAAGGALYAGIKKKDFDKKAEDLDKKMQDIKNMSDAEFLAFLKDMATYQELKEQYDSICKIKHDYQNQATKLGNVRTALMAGNAATAVAGTIISNKNNNDSIYIKDMILKCKNAINTNKQKIGQTIFDCVAEQHEKLGKVVSECEMLSIENMDKLRKINKTSTVVSGVNIGTATVGTVTSALANKNQYDQQTKNLNTAANVLAGVSGVASGTATVLNAVTMKAVNNNIAISEACEREIDKL